MSNTPNNPINPSDPQGPWIYSGAAQPTNSYYTSPAATPAPPLPPPVSPPTPPAGPPSPPVARPPATPPAPRPTPQPAVPIPHSDASLASVIDTIEAIIIALIIALTFRAFIVEAFVIPTGSMAPTLLGAHFKVICPECGYEFDRNASLTNQYVHYTNGTSGIPSIPDNHAELLSNTSVPSDETPVIYCPNCFYPIRPEQLPQHLETRQVIDGRRDNMEHNVPFAWANNGDRILVLKYLYSILEPSRWDVIVFKEPQGAKDNYIKRLIGRPGETIEIVNGDVFIAPPGQTSPADRVIARKPEFLQKSLWQNVYNNDFYPIDEGSPRPPVTRGARIVAPVAWQNPWQPASGDWDPSGTLIKTCRSDKPAALQFELRAPYGQNILGYNEKDIFYPGEILYPVDDLRLETLWAPANDAAATLSVTLGRPDNCFRVNWTKDGLKLSQYTPADKSYAPVAATILATPLPQGGKSYRIAMENVDHVIRFYIDDQLVLSHETPWSAADATREERQQVEQRREFALDTQIRFDVGGSCSLSHLKLFRDLYYTQQSGADGTATQGHPITLGPDEFFAMGDNSRNSSDGRFWDKVFPALDDLGTRPGIVPRRYLLGKAFFVYWPAGFRPSNNVPFPLVPNAGDMRLIR